MDPSVTVGSQVCISRRVAVIVVSGADCYDIQMFCGLSRDRERCGCAVAFLF